MSGFDSYDPRENKYIEGFIPAAKQEDGTYYGASLDHPLPVQISPTAKGSFGRARVAQPYTLFDSKQLFDNLPLFYDDQETSGTGTTSTHSPLKASSTMTVSENTAGKRTRQTFQRFNYQPGKSLLCMMTGNLRDSGGGLGITTRMGYFDDNNGVFASCRNGYPAMSIRSGVSGAAVDDQVFQENWNGDKLDGTGASGYVLDLTKTHIFWFDMEWLGVGSVRAGYVINGRFITCHTFHHANIERNVYMSTPNLPIRYEIENDGTGVASGMQHICSTVISEGGIQPIGQLHYHSTEGTHINANTANVLYPVVGLKLKTTHIGAQVDLDYVSMINATNDDFEWVVAFNPTLSGTLTFTDHPNSAVQLATGDGTVTATDHGHEIAGGFTKSTASISTELKNALKLGASIAGVRDEVWLCVRPLTSNADIDGGIGWRELS